jgi:hypothetical protein
MRSPRKVPHRDQCQEERGATGGYATKRRMVVVIAMLVSLGQISRRVMSAEA